MEKFKFLSKSKVSQLPKSPGVYTFKKGAKLLYIGKATNLRERVKQHFKQPRRLFNQLQGLLIGYIETDSEIEALILEANLIKKYKPKYNIVWRDDKNYFFVGITKEDFPKVFWTHQTKLKIINCKLKIDYVGPFVDGKALKQTLKVLREVFPYRSCNKIPKHPCLWYQLKRCLAPCLLKSAKSSLPEGTILFVKIQKEVKETSQRNVKNLIKILQGKKLQVLRDLKKEMEKFSASQDYEKAAKIRDQIESFEKVLSHAKIFDRIETDVITKPWQRYDVKWQKIGRELQKILKIKREISRIEAYDVSNIQGQKATGSMITFLNGLPDKNFYRKFKIRISGLPNDVAMIKEVLTRRIKHPEWGLPDLILIDGGIAQLSAASKIKNKKLKIKNKIRVISLAKKENKLYIEKQKKPILLKTLPQEIFNLILQLRDEAHRFARKYHLKLRSIDLFSKS